MNLAGLIYGAETHYLDHLAPLCALKKIPLIVTDDGIAELARSYYLDLDLLHWDPLSAPEKLVSRFDRIICSTPRALFDEVFYFAQAMHGKRVGTVWCPHGNSDKGRHTPFMEGLAEEEALYTYGPRIESFLAEKGVKGRFIRVGNYRYSYYKKHRSFYDALLPKKEKPTLFYAPTWQDQEENSSFPELFPYLEKAPEKFELIVKPHPNLLLQFPDEIEQLKRLPNLTLLERFPPIYPLLARSDLYIGDMSSIGYDFLAFEKPMLLTCRSPLLEAGALLTSFEDLFPMCEDLIGTKPPASLLYEETFAPTPKTLESRV